MTDLRQLAKGQPCMVRTPGCNHDQTTTVLAHLNGAGMARKVSDWHGAWCCSSCHDVVDRRIDCGLYTLTELELTFYRAVIKTQEAIFAEGITPDMPVKRQRSSKILPRTGF